MDPREINRAIDALVGLSGRELSPDELIRETVQLLKQQSVTCECALWILTLLGQGGVQKVLQVLIEFAEDPEAAKKTIPSVVAIGVLHDGLKEYIREICGCDIVQLEALIKDSWISIAQALEREVERSQSRRDVVAIYKRAVEVARRVSRPPIWWS